MCLWLKKTQHLTYSKTDHWNQARSYLMCSLILHVFPPVLPLPRRIWSGCLISGWRGWWTRTLSVIPCRWTQSVEPPPGTTLWSEKKTVSLWLYNHKENPPVQGECVWGESQLNHESSALISNRIRVEERGYSFKPFSQ